MTPPLPLAELVKTWEERSQKCYGDGEYTAEYHLDRCIDELRALPLGRCDTCRHCHDKPNDRDYRSICGHPLAIDANKGNEMMTPWPFGCPLHEPAPPVAGEETR